MDTKNERPDLEGNDETAAGGALGGSTAGEATADIKAVDDAQKGGVVPYAAAGGAFTAWFNGMLTKVPNPTLRLGTKTARVETLHDDGRLEVYLQGEGGRDERQYVAFEAKYLDALLLKFAAASRA